MLNVRSVHDEDKVLRFVRFKHVGDEYPHLDYYEFVCGLFGLIAYKRKEKYGVSRDVTQAEAI